MAYENLSPEELAAKFGGVPVDAPQTQDLEALARKFGGVAVQAPVTLDDPGALQAGLIGAGRTADRMIEGAKQAGLGVGAILSELLPGNLRDRAQNAIAQKLTQQANMQAGNTAAYQPLQAAHPIASVVGESAPLVPLPLGGSLATAAAIGAAPGLLEYGNAQERAIRGAGGAAGGALGYGVGKLIGAVASPGMKAASPETERLAQAAQQEGIPLDAAQVTGNRVLQNAKAALSRMPWTASGQQAREAAQQSAYNAALLKRIGSNASAATPDVMADAYNGITRSMNDAANSVALTLDDASVAKLASVEKNLVRRLPTDQKSVIRSYLDDLTQVIGEQGAIPGDVYNKTRSELGRIAANTDNITLREGAKGIQNVLDDAFDRQAPEGAVQAMKQARTQYSRYLTLENALKKARSTAGDLSAKQVYAQAQQDIPGFVRGGGGSFNDLVRAGRQFLPDPIPNSGTAERMMYQNLLAAGTMGGLGALGGQLANGDPSTGAAAGLIGFGVSKGAQRMLNSPQLTKYLMAQVISEQQKQLLARTGGLLGVSAANALIP